MEEVVGSSTAIKPEFLKLDPRLGSLRREYCPKVSVKDFNHAIQKALDAAAKIPDSLLSCYCEMSELTHEGNWLMRLGIGAFTLALLHPISRATLHFGSVCACTFFSGKILTLLESWLSHGDHEKQFVAICESTTPCIWDWRLHHTKQETYRRTVVYKKVCILPSHQEHGEAICKSASETPCILCWLPYTTTTETDQRTALERACIYQLIMCYGKEHIDNQPLPESELKLKTKKLADLLGNRLRKQLSKQKQD